MTPTTVGWVMADGRVEGCPTVSGDEFGVTRGDAGLDAVSMAASASAVAVRARTALAAGGERLRGIGVTWSDAAAVGAALVLESLADAGFDHVVPVRFSRAAATLAGGLGGGMATGGERTAVCVIEPGSATLVLLEGAADEDPLVAARPIGGTDDVVGWLADAFGRGGRRPGVLMLAGSMRGMDRLGRRLETSLSVPVFVQGGAQQALARGAALAIAPHADLAVPGTAGAEIGAYGASRSMSLSYAGALTMLTGGAVTFVASVSAALSLQLGPSKELPEVRQPEHVTVARVASPAAAPPAAPVAPAELPEPTAELGSLWDGPAVEPGPPAPPPGEPSLLDRVRERMPRLPGR